MTLGYLVEGNWQLSSGSNVCESIILGTPIFDGNDIHVRPARAPSHAFSLSKALADAVLEQGKLDTTLEHATAGSELCQQFDYVRWRVTGSAVVARVHRVRRVEAHAQSILDQAFALFNEADAWTDLMTR